MEIRKTIEIAKEIYHQEVLRLLKLQRDALTEEERAIYGLLSQQLAKFLMEQLHSELFSIRIEE